MSRLRSEQAGFTLIELMVAEAISLVILSATMTVFTVMYRERAASERVEDAQRLARQGVDRMSRQLRNLASPADFITAATSAQPKAVDRDLPFDLIFKDIDETSVTAPVTNPANVRRVRYCLQTSGTITGTGAAASASRGVLWQQVQRTSSSLPVLPAAPPAATACPGSGWDSARLVADYLTNANAASPRALFRYSSDTTEVTGTDAAARALITRVETNVFVDPDPTRRPVEKSLVTSVVLRNQNRAPVALFTKTAVGTCSVQLNGSASEDPENKRLTYRWFDNGVAMAGLEDRVVVQKALTPGTHVITLQVSDPAGLTDTSDPQSVTC
jgi:prepilin-type N-terminal cleavage/methylation domain-containing protein